MSPTFRFSFYFFLKYLCYYMTLDTQNLKIVCILIIIHPLIYRKKYKGEKSFLIETLSLFKVVFLETCGVQILVNNERGWRDKGTLF